MLLCDFLPLFALQIFRQESQTLGSVFFGYCFHSKNIFHQFYYWINYWIGRSNLITSFQRCHKAPRTMLSRFRLSIKQKFSIQQGIFNIIFSLFFCTAEPFRSKILCRKTQFLIPVETNLNFKCRGASF